MKGENMNGRNKTDTIADITIASIALVIIILKLTGLLKLSWWIILAPIWIAFGVGLLLLAIVIVSIIIRGIIEIIRRKEV